MSMRYAWDRMGDRLKDTVTGFDVTSTKGYDTKAIGERVAEVRKMRRATQVGAAERAGIAGQTLSNIECGRTPSYQMKTLSRIAKALDVDIVWLLHGEISDADVLTFAPEVKAEDILSPTVGKRLVMARKLRGLTQGQLGRAMGMTQGSVSQWEKGYGKMSRDRIRVLAEYLKVNTVWLETGSGPMEAGDKAEAMRDEIRKAFDVRPGHDAGSQDGGDSVVEPAGWEGPAVPGVDWEGF